MRVVDDQTIRIIAEKGTLQVSLQSAMLFTIIFNLTFLVSERPNFIVTDIIS